MTFLRAELFVFLAVCILKGSFADISKPQEAQQLLKYNSKTKQFVLDSRCLVEMSKLQGPIVVVSAVGDARIGKSTTWNLIRHFWNKNSLQIFHETFKTGNTVVPVTHGVWASIIPSKSPDDSNVILLDVEGLNVGDDDVTVHLSMFTTLVSSEVHIFADDLVKNNVLDFLYFISRNTEMIFPDERFDNFPHLGIVVRGALETPPGYTLEEYIHDFILGFDNSDGKQGERNTIRKYFLKDKIYANQIPYVHDTTIFKDMRQLRNSDFYKVILSLVGQFKEIPPKKSLRGDRMMDGESLAAFMKELFHTMNNDSWMEFNNAYRMLEGQICAKAYAKIVGPVLNEEAREIGLHLENTLTEFKTKCALEDEVESARKALLEAKKKADEMKEMKRIAEEQKNLREEIETEMETARGKWEKVLDEKDELLSRESEKRQQLQMQNQKLEEDVERQSQQISQLQNAPAGSGEGGGGAEQFFGSAVGAAMATFAYFNSDQRLKQNITILPHSEYDNVCLRGVTWQWNDSAKRQFGLSGGGRGVIAQDVEKLYPFAVKTRSDGYKQVNYKTLWLMIRAAHTQRQCVSSGSPK